MRIGIDGKHISNLQRGGFKTYSIILLENLAVTDNENEYFVYFDRPVNLDILPRRENIHYKIIKAVNPFKTVLREQFLLARASKKDKLDLFHFPANTAAIFFPVKYLLTVHDVIALLPVEKLCYKQKTGSIKQYLLNKYDKYVIPRVVAKAGHIITVSQNSKKEIMDMFQIRNEMISVVYGNLMKDFDPKKDIKAGGYSQKSGNYILALGSIDLRKNIVTLLKAFSGLKELDVELFIVSSHPVISEYLRKESSNCGIIERVRILEDVSNEELIKLYSDARLFVFPSYYEGFGLPVLEAMSLSVPVICSKTSSLPEVGGNAVKYIDPRSPEELISAIREILSNEELAGRMRIEGQIQAQKFSGSNCAKEIIEVYKKINKKD